MYKYVFKKNSAKDFCPQCGKKKFNRMFDNETGAIAPSIYGYCERKINCNYSNMPNNNIITNKIVAPPPPKITSFHDPSLLQSCSKHFDQNKFITFLKRLFTDDEVQRIINRFSLGTAKRWKGATIFWQIDEKGKVRAGQIVLYDPVTGSKKKYNDKTCISWVHTCLLYQKQIREFNLEQCLFGLHQIKNIDSSTHKPICIVESAKTACIMSEYCPEFIWMSCGNREGLRYRLLKPLRKYTIIAIPDNDSVEDWKQKTAQLTREGFDISCNTEIKTIYIEPNDDIADAVIRDLLDSLQQTKTIKQSQNKNNIEAAYKVKTILSPEENKLQQLAKINPKIINLINTFDLTDIDGEDFRLSEVAEKKKF